LTNIFSVPVCQNVRTLPPFVATTVATLRVAGAPATSPVELPATGGSCATSTRALWSLSGVEGIVDALDDADPVGLTEGSGSSPVQDDSATTDTTPRIARVRWGRRGGWATVTVLRCR